MTEAYYRFFKQLAANNNRDWFQAHKDEYLSNVFTPFKALTEEVIVRMNDIDPNIQITFKESAFRIYRDVRFSKDKSPYKLWLGAVVGRKGRKNTQYPEIYFQFGYEQNFIGAGLYRPDKTTLQNIRTAIADDPQAFDEILHDKEMLKYFPKGIQGECNKRLSKEWMAVAAKQAYILNKQFFTYKELSKQEVISKSNLALFITKHYLAMQRWNQFLIEINNV